MVTVKKATVKAICISTIYIYANHLVVMVRRRNLTDQSEVKNKFKKRCVKVVSYYMYLQHDCHQDYPMNELLVSLRN